jgi:hypothetical protein
MGRAMKLRVIPAAVLGLAIAAVGAGAASADPANAKSHLPLTLECGSGPVSAVTNGSGGFTPAHVTDGTGVFIPILFGAQEGVFTDPEGNEFPFSDVELFPKGSANPKGKTIVDCTFVIDTTFPDGSSLFVEGAVTGFFTH